MNEIYTQIQNKIIKSETYKGFRYFIKSLGTHPCAYVEITKELYYKRLDNVIYCHGGITFQEQELISDDEKYKGYFIGWDYSHAWDAMYIHGENRFLIDGKQWTLEEIVNECESVIDQLIAFTSDQ